MGSEARVRELLNEVTPQYSGALSSLVDDTVSAIRECIDQIPAEVGAVTADLAASFVGDVGADKVEFRFKRPESIEIGGSYSIECVAKPDVSVDVYVPLPKECFHEKDYLNHRYHAKRCLYLCVLSKYLGSWNVQWSTLHNEARKPVLLLFPATKLAAAFPGFHVRLIPTATSLFNISKLHPRRNNVRAFTQGGHLQPTPFYNNSILEDMVIESTHNSIKKVFLGSKQLREALLLLKVWARQRPSIYAHDCLNGFLLSVILCNLATSGEIKDSMNAMQMVRIAYSFIARQQFLKRGLYLQLKDHNAVLKEDSVEECMTFNLGFRMSAVGCLLLQHEAATTLECIENCEEAGFGEIYMTRMDFPAKYDLCIRLNLKGNNDVYKSGFCLDNECWRIYEQKVQNVLVEGLSDRVKLVRVIWNNTPSECIIEDGLLTFCSEPLLIGISMSSVEKAYRMVDIGPNPEKKDEALKFRKFWGEKAELRRFQDTTIAESTVWNIDQWERHLIMKKISEYVLTRHLSLSKGNITHIVDQLDFSLIHGAKDPISFSSSLLDAFDALSKRLRLIEDIPLKISTVLPLDSAFRFTSVFPPEPHPLANEKSGALTLSKFTPTCIQSLEVMIQLEGSGNWPMDEAAIEKTKSAFLVQIGKSLQNNWGMMCTATEDGLDVFLSGYAFCLIIWHERGLSLLNRANNDRLKKVSSIDKELFFRSQHASMINGLQGRFPVYAQVCRLAKRWVASHLFSSCLGEEAIELLVAHIFLKPLPFDVPFSRVTGFLRFLRLISNHDWAFSPLVVDINNDLAPKFHGEITGKFLSSRKAYDVEPAMFLATAYDSSSQAWTRFSPTTSELKRLVAYTRSSANLLTKLVEEDHSDSSGYTWECLLRTPLNNFDAVVLLQREKLAHPRRLLFPSELKQGIHVAHGVPSKSFHPFLSSTNKKPMVAFDPLKCFIEDLEDFQNAFKMWYDSLGGDAVGLTWSSSMKRGQEDKVDNPTKLLKAVGEAGKGFVRSVYLLKAPNSNH